MAPMIDEKGGDITNLQPAFSQEENVVKHFARDTVNAQAEYTEAEYKKLLRKIDWILLPLIYVTCGTQMADKTSVGVQATFGLIDDLRLHGQQFAWLSTIFYISYMIFEPPVNYLMQRYNSGKTLAYLMLFWGIIVLCTAFTENFTQIVILRALQGAAESIVYPFFLLIVGAFYTTKEIPLRCTIWGTANAGVSIITSFINYGIGAYAQSHPGGLAPWKGISVFLGTLTLVLSVITYLFLGTPREVRWLSPAEKRMAAARVVGNLTGSDRVERRAWKWDQVLIAFKDPQTYFLFLVNLINAIPNGGTTSFGNLVYVSFGFTPLETLIKGTVPQNLLGIAWFLFGGFLTMKKQGILFYLMMISTVPAFVGMLTLALLPKDGFLWLRWGMFLITATGDFPGLLYQTLIPLNVAGRTKKAVTYALFFIAFSIGNMIGTQVFREKDAPKYLPAILTCSIMYGIQFAFFLAWMLYYKYENRRRDRLVTEMGISKAEAAHQGRLNAEEDMTDYENLHFRYEV